MAPLSFWRGLGRLHKDFHFLADRETLRDEHSSPRGFILPYNNSCIGGFNSLGGFYLRGRTQSRSGRIDRALFLVAQISFCFFFNHHHEPGNAVLVGHFSHCCCKYGTRNIPRNGAFSGVQPHHPPPAPRTNPARPARPRQPRPVQQLPESALRTRQGRSGGRSPRAMGAESGC